MSWKSLVERVRDTVVDAFNPLGRLVGKIPHGGDPLRIMPFLGYGTPAALFLSGRVLEDTGSIVSEADDSALENLVAAFRRFETDEVKGAIVRATCSGVSSEATTDSEGYFEFDLRPPHPAEGENSWRKVELELLAPSVPGGVRAEGEVLVPPRTARFGVISDIDDTVLQTNVSSKLRMLLATVLENAHTRLPFEGVAALYAALERGAGGDEGNPIFYVSSSPWNLYDPLVEFMDIHGLPKGPILLRDYGVRMLKTLRDHHAHKLGKIRPLLKLYPDLKFILVGDSGEQDPEIYLRIAKEFPGRIQAVYIRTVDASTVRQNQMAAIAREMAELGCVFVPVADSAAAAAHASANGWIAPPSVEQVQEQKEKDKESPRPDEVLQQQEQKQAS
jgi:phosphatidate phosphatase APP1